MNYYHKLIEDTIRQVNEKRDKAAQLYSEARTLEKELDFIEEVLSEYCREVFNQKHRMAINSYTCCFVEEDDVSINFEKGYVNISSENHRTFYPYDRTEMQWSVEELLENKYVLEGLEEGNEEEWFIF